MLINCLKVTFSFYIICRNILYKIDIFASLSCFLNSTDDGLPEKNRSINDNEKIQVKQNQAPFEDFRLFDSITF